VSWSRRLSDRFSAEDSGGGGEVGLVNGDDVGSARGAHRDRSGRIGQQRELAQRVTPAVLADHGAGALIDDLESARADDVHFIPGVTLAEQPFSCGEAARA
jgi:hypothetical protein